MINGFRIKKKWLVAVFIFSCLAAYFAIPEASLFNDPYSLVIKSREGELLGAHIAKDEQWRFPSDALIPKKFVKAITQFEDKRFFNHPGFDVLAFSRAIIQNIKAKKKVSGGSTITMQVVRLSRKGKPRTYSEKIIEIVKAIKLEIHFSKNEILNLYASNAPFGGNVVGLKAASWRYFGKEAKELTWAEISMLAVLPNSPSLIHPGKNRQRLEEKRNKLLQKLNSRNIISKETYELSLLESIPPKPIPFPNIAPHLMIRILNSEGKIHYDVKTSIYIQLQKDINKIINNHSAGLQSNHINNLAVIVLSVMNNEVIAYNANVLFTENTDENNGYVDNIVSNRSTGSILKPFLYAAMLSSGEILPEALIPDIPTNIGGFIPKNYNRGYDGSMPAYKALARSLNIPAVRMLRDFGVQKFHHVLQETGITSLTKQADHYGLSLILGGAEASLWELSGAYASMARSLNNFNLFSSKYQKNSFKAPSFYMKKKSNKIYPDDLENFSIYSASAHWLTFNTLLEVERPPTESGWKYFENANRIAWKTGTSFGFRDAWAIGFTPEYLVGVWVGNSDGEGRPGLTGINSAAPVLFDVFKLLPLSNKWFEKPHDDFIEISVCVKSGFLASPNCPVKKSLVPLNGERFKLCPYHHLIHLDSTSTYRVSEICELPQNMVHTSWFVLPPTMEWYYRKKHPYYKILPDIRKDCKTKFDMFQNGAMEVIYPQSKSKIFIPVELSGERGRTIFEIAHRSDNAIIYWHLDEFYLGQTTGIHQFDIDANIGLHTITIIDNFGEMLTFDFQIIDQEKTE